MILQWLRNLLHRPRKTGFDRYFEEQMQSPKFAKTYTEARQKIDAYDQAMRVRKTSDKD